MDMKKLQLGDIVIEVEQKNIKNIHLRVYPPAGNVKISAPRRMDLNSIRVFAISRLDWIRKQQAKIMAQHREAPREYLSGESHYYNGQRYCLKVIEVEAPPRVELEPNTMVMYVRPGTDAEKKQAILDAWYRRHLKAALPGLIEKWEKALHVKVRAFGIKEMKTRWGSCNPTAQRIWLNLELVRRPPECLEYVVVHEMVHLLERKHNNIFKAYMDQYLPQWQFYKDELNRLPAQKETGTASD